jgi:type II secretion system protein G
VRYTSYMKRAGKSGFTLIELLVVIAIIGLLAAIVLTSLNSAKVKTRDTQRKAAFHQIQTALDVYYAKFGSYPSTSCGVTPNCGAANYSTQGSWLPALVTDGEFPSGAPKDPINIDKGPWCWGTAAPNTSQSDIIVYMSDGQHYVLCGWLEATDDPMQLKFKDVPNPWNKAEGLRSTYFYSDYTIAVGE